jgi:ATP-dependent DNA helicase Q4
MSKVIKETLKVKCILALTATATRQTQLSIAQLLSIPPEGIFQYSPIRSNLKLFVHEPKDKYATEHYR